MRWLKILLFYLLFSSVAFAATYSRAIFFGDSLTDTGNNQTDQDHKRGVFGAPITNKNAAGVRLLWVNYLLAKGKKNQLFSSDRVVLESSAKRAGNYAAINYAWAGAKTIDGYANKYG